MFSWKHVCCYNYMKRNLRSLQRQRIHRLPIEVFWFQLFCLVSNSFVPKLNIILHIFIKLNGIKWKYSAWRHLLTFQVTLNMYVWCWQEIIESKTDNRSYGKQWSWYFSAPNKIPERFLSTWPTFSMLTCNLPALDVSPEKQSGLLNYFLVNKRDFCEKSEEGTKM